MLACRFTENKYCFADRCIGAAAIKDNRERMSACSSNGNSLLLIWELAVDYVMLVSTLNTTAIHLPIPSIHPSVEFDCFTVFQQNTADTIHDSIDIIGLTPLLFK
ncbi:hypothetical protein CANARDRAFT_93471 [[Candida] arabinofermentans NRRL YB-2248]|uniref:Uncharacterized protein n=1 Tax=[Candida] arabinofermentans NRRL YB-2248 TaxID=983967 RepID=A0A1E4T6G5_9ASCO|nr:hypothetical protein CANARDRAFT_93471 [[Candida] arabinofermentans NRRL YB-2248]